MDPLTKPKDGPAEPRPGDVLGEFRILHKIGEGAMGIVYEARQESLQRRVALKVLPVGGAADGQAVTRFYREARAAARLTHPNIVPVYGFGVEQGSYYYAMEFVAGPSLHQLVHKETDPLRDERQVAKYINAVALALDVAHKQGVIHRDVKPANILIREDDQAAITDFGLARQERKRSITQVGALMGTPVYMAPEQARGEKVDHKIDIYALGVTLYECLTGKVPFLHTKLRKLLIAITTEPPTPPSQLCPGLSPDLEAIVLKALAKDPNERYAGCKEMSDDLIRYFRGDVVLAREAGKHVLAARQLRKHPVTAFLSAAVVLLVLAWVIGNPYLMRQRNVERAAARLQEARALIAGPLEKHHKANQQLTTARAARDTALHRLGVEGRKASRTAGGAVTRAALSLERADELLLARQGDERSIAERGRDLLDEVLVLVPTNDPLHEEVRALSRDLVRAQLHTAVRDGNRDLAEVRRGELIALGEEVAGGAKASLNVESDPPGAQVFVFLVNTDARGDWTLDAPRDMGRTPLDLREQFAPGEYVCELVLDGRNTLRVPFVLQASQSHQIRLELPRADSVPPGFVYVAPSEFMAGGDPAAVRPLFRAPQPIWVSGFFLGSREVSVAEYLEFLNATAQGRAPRSRQFKKDGEAFTAASHLLEHPAAGVSRTDALAYCAWLSTKDGQRTYRLPTAVEWEKAARGPTGRFFPWGRTFSLAGGDPRAQLHRGELKSGVGTVPGGSMTGDRSIYGFFDMGGNLSEWVNDSFGGNSDGVLRGGSWARAPEIIRSASREPVSPRTFDSVAHRVGFRVAFD
jgi:formylglycine-generating enzyme required for sulfatase activity/predicted Ser/Thr protein kinase